MSNTKRKTEEDINDRLVKIAKLDVPQLVPDTLIELLDRLNTKDLLTASLVNKEFNTIARNLLCSREVTVSDETFYNTTKEQLSFVMQLKKLSIESKVMMTGFHKTICKRLLAQLTNLQSLRSYAEGFIFPVVNKLTQLKSLRLDFRYLSCKNETLKLSKIPFGTFKELGSLSLANMSSSAIVDSDILPCRLTSLTLHYANITSLRKFTNLEHLCFLMNSGHMTIVNNLIETEAFDLPRLTSLEVPCARIDFSKCTRLKALKNCQVRGYVPEKPLSLPPNLEQFTASEMNLSHLPAAIPSTMKYLFVGCVRKTISVEQCESFFNLVRSVDQKCCIILGCHNFVDVPTDIKTRPNLTIKMSNNNYENTSWSNMMNFFSGPLPQRLHIKFTNWSTCYYKPNILAQIKMLETKTRLLVDYQDAI